MDDIPRGVRNQFFVKGLGAQQNVGFAFPWNISYASLGETVSGTHRKKELSNSSVAILRAFACCFPCVVCGENECCEPLCFGFVLGLLACPTCIPSLIVQTCFGPIKEASDGPPIGCLGIFSSGPPTPDPVAGSVETTPPIPMAIRENRV